jgi:hypothetical protein
MGLHLEGQVMKTIYWAPMVGENYVMSYLDQHEPDRLLNHINKNSFQDYKEPHHNFRVCPAFIDLFKNTYALRFTHDYKLEIFDNTVASKMIDEDFFNSQIRWRSDDKRFLGFNLFYYFFCEEDMTMSVTPSYFDDNSFNSSAILMPGVFNISKWFRPVECAFIVRNDCGEVTMKKGDVYAYVHFHTDEKIKFKRFHASQEIIDLGANFIRFNKKNLRPTMSMIPFYDAFTRTKMKKMVMKKIKENLLD